MSGSGSRWPARSCATRRCLLLDEPTANLDGETEREIVRTIAHLAEGRTVVLVAHRPALIAVADRVLSLSPIESPRENRVPYR